MRNKKTFVGLFVILALLCLGIGYAAISKSLTISGNVGTGSNLDDNFKVYFTGIYPDYANAPEGVEITVDLDKPGGESLSAGFGVSNLSTVGMSVSFELPVKNGSANNLKAAGPDVSVLSVDENGNELDVLHLDAFFPLDSTYPSKWIFVTEDGYVEVWVMAEGAAATSLAAGEEQKVTVIVRLKNAPLEEKNYNFILQLTYQAVEANN